MSTPQAHCPSWYAATRNDTTDYPPLRGETSSDVCIVGAGFTGLSAALALAERGYTVTVLEQHRIGWGASGRCGGQVIGGIPGEHRLQQQWGVDCADTLFELGYRGHDIIRRRVEQFTIACDLKWGYMDVALRPRHLAQQHASYESHCARGLEDKLSLVPAAELPALLGTERYRGGLLNRLSGHLHPLNLCLGEARAARALGVAVHEGSEVTGIRHGVMPVVTTRQGSVRAGCVVLAGNAYQYVGADLLPAQVFSAPSFIVATEPLTAEEAGRINPRDIAVCDQNLVPDYFRLSADRRLLFGGRCHYSGREARHIEHSMRKRLRAVYPMLAQKRLDFSWSGNIGVVLNRVPLLGRHGDNIYYSLGYSGHGVSLSHTCGEIVADAIGGTLERFDVFAGVPHRRIPLGQRRLNSYLVAMGMLYYRLRDLL